MSSFSRPELLGVFSPGDARAGSRPPTPDGRNHIKATTAEDRDWLSLPRPQQLRAIPCPWPFAELDGGHLNAHPKDHGWEEQPSSTTSKQKGAVDLGAILQVEAKFQVPVEMHNLHCPASSEPSLLLSPF